MQWSLTLDMRFGGATVARLTPDQKVACSNHVRVNDFFLALFNFDLILDAPFQNCFTWSRKDGAHKLFKTHPILWTLTFLRFDSNCAVLVWQITVVEALLSFYFVALEYVNGSRINVSHHLHSPSGRHCRFFVVRRCACEWNRLDPIAGWIKAQSSFTSKNICLPVLAK